MRSTPWMLITFSFATAMTVGLVIWLATGLWLALPVALVVHFVGTMLVVGVTGKALTQTSKPDPVTEARQDEEGVRRSREQQPEQRKPVI